MKHIVSKRVLFFVLACASVNNSFSQIERTNRRSQLIDGLNTLPNIRNPFTLGTPLQISGKVKLVQEQPDECNTIDVTKIHIIVYQQYVPVEKEFISRLPIRNVEGFTEGQYWLTNAQNKDVKLDYPLLKKRIRHTSIKSDSTFNLNFNGAIFLDNSAPFVYFEEALVLENVEKRNGSLELVTYKVTSMLVTYSIEAIGFPSPYCFFYLPPEVEIFLSHLFFSKNDTHRNVGTVTVRIGYIGG